MRYVHVFCMWVFSADHFTIPCVAAVQVTWMQSLWFFMLLSSSSSMFLSCVNQAKFQPGKLKANFYGAFLFDFRLFILLQFWPKCRNKHETRRKKIPTERRKKKTSSETKNSRDCQAHKSKSTCVCLKIFDIISSNVITRHKMRYFFCVLLGCCLSSVVHCKVRPVRERMNERKKNTELGRAVVLFRTKIAHF